MKKRVWLFLVVVISVLCMVAFAACGNKETEEGAGSASISADYDYTLIESKVNELAGADGIFVKLHVQTAATGEQSHSFDVALGIKNNVYYYLTEEDEYYFDFSNENYYVSYSKEDGVWTKEVGNYNAYVTKAMAEQMAKAASAGIIGYMGWYSSLSGGATKSTATVAGRNCDKYTLKDIAISASYSLEVCIDKATGICLKYAATGAVQGESASVSIECTEFNTSYTPVLPTVNGGNNSQGSGNGNNQGNNQGSGESGNNQGSGEGGNNQGSGQGGNGEGGNGEQGSGEVIVPSNFSGKKLNVTNVNVQTMSDAHRQEAQALFNGAYAALFSDASFELVNNEGILFGTFTVPDNGTVAQLATFKSYNFDDQEYSYDFPSTYDSLSLSYVAGAYILHMPVPVENGATVVDVGLTMTASTEMPMRSSVPTDPNGDSFDARYQVTQERWNDIFTNKALLDNGNFTVNYSSTAQLSVPGVFKVSGNKYSDAWSNGEVYYEKTGNTLDSLGCYTYSYIYSSNGSWTSLPASYGYVFFDQWLGTFPAPFLNRANYASFFHYYYINEFRFTPEGASQQRVITNFRVYFSNGNPTKIEFQEMGASYTFLFSAYGETTVTLPTEGGGQGGSQGSGDPSDLDQYCTALENKVLVFNRVTNGGGLTSGEMTLASAAYQNAQVRVFDDDTVEIYFDKLFDYNANYDVVTMWYGALSFNMYMANNGNPYVKGTVVLSAIVEDGSVDDEPDESIYVRWYINDSQLRLQMDGGDYFIYFDVTNGTPTHTPIPQSGGEGGNGNENGQGGNGGNGGNGGEGGNTQGGENVRTTIYTDFGTETNLHDTIMRFGMGDGVKIVMTVDEATYTFVGKEGVFFTDVDGFSTYYDLRDEENIDCYYYEEGNWGVLPLDSMDAARSAMLDMFNYHYANYDGATRTEKSVTIGKSDVSAYRYETDYGDVFELDQNTGIVLYYNDGDGWIEEVTTFLFEDDVEALELPALL